MSPELIQLPKISEVKTYAITFCLGDDGEGLLKTVSGISNTPILTAITINATPINTFIFMLLIMPHLFFMSFNLLNSPQNLL